MKVGLLARCEDRGLGTLTREWFRHMHPHRTLVVLPPNDLPKHLDWYPRAQFVRWGHDNQANFDRRDVDVVRDFLADVDVVYSAETFYDWRICDWARSQRTATVCHMMPEYLRSDSHPQPDAWWTPTTWRLAEVQHMVGEVSVVPVPIPIDRWPAPESFEPHDPIRWLHPAGACAAMDRNGTSTFMRALRRLREPHEIVLRAQESLQYPRVGRSTRLEVHETSSENYWEQFDGIDAVVLPRKYAGLSLPAQEAMGASCALFMPAVSPNTDWPIVPLRCALDGELRAYGNAIPLAVTQPASITQAMDDHARHPARITQARQASRSYAEAHSWQACEQMIREHLDRSRASAS